MKLIFADTQYTRQLLQFYKQNKRVCVNIYEEYGLSDTIPIRCIEFMDFSDVDFDALNEFNDGIELVISDIFKEILLKHAQILLETTDAFPVLQYAYLVNNSGERLRQYSVYNGSVMCDYEDDTKLYKITHNTMPLADHRTFIFRVME